MVAAAAVVAAAGSVVAWQGASGRSRPEVDVIAVATVPTTGRTTTTAPTRTAPSPRSISAARRAPRTTAGSTTTTRPVHVVPTYPAHLSDLPNPKVVAPVGVAIDRPAIAGPVMPVGVEPTTGELSLPPDHAMVAWYQYGPTPGATGSSVLAGHVDWGGVEGVFFRLGEVDPGAVVTVGYAGGSARRFRVVSRRLVAKTLLPVAEVFARSGPPTLVLITCGGSFDASVHHYRSNVVVTAVPVS
jgi:hypothetical protein